jgi:probable HAF family extracellular repeat protein
MFPVFGFRRQTGWFLVVVTGCVCFGAPGSDRAWFRGLGDLPGGAVESYARAVSADGQTVVGQSVSKRSGWNGEAFVWSSADGMIGLGSFDHSDSYESEAWGVSADGEVVVGSGAIHDHGQAFRWTAAEGMVGLGYLNDDHEFSWAWDVSDDGLVVVGESVSERSDGRSEPFRWTAEDGMVGLGTFSYGRYPSRALGTNADGSVVVGIALVKWEFEAFRWTESDGLVGLGHLEGERSSWGVAVSGDGSVVVGQAAAGHGASYREAPFRWTAEDGIVELPCLPSRQIGGTAWDVSDDGRIVVGNCWVNGFSVAFIWDELHATRNLKDVLDREYGVDLTEWKLHAAYGISSDGRTIAGTSHNSDGEAEAFLAHLGTIRLGDVNCDESIDFDDIDPFVLILTDPDEYRRRFPDCDAGLGDVNRDEVVDFNDIDGFVCCLIEGSCYDCH